MSYRWLKLITILLPTMLIGGFELLRHSIFLHQIPMSIGNYLIILLTLLIMWIFSTWMFKIIAQKNKRLAAEKEMRAIYEERERLAKELHDNIAQTLFLLKINLSKGKIQEAKTLINSIDGNLRQAIYNLRTNPQEIPSLQKRIETWINDWITVSGIEVKTSIKTTKDAFSTAEEVQLFGIIQEAFTNIRKHSQATTAILQLSTNTDNWSLLIKDNGKGITSKEDDHSHYGLVMLKERAQKMNATLEIISELNCGTTIVVQKGGN
ncbi:sensor histidine kinase [Bacillus rubiinfantis]|uniref:sensor histidine kinase n=1 Tax=Bacillus rubiinfantis TaxID=1499680 RepID=UPI0005AAD886|nr:ATP-binding protein [Bacillus rubiinfantis]